PLAYGALHELEFFLKKVLSAFHEDDPLRLRCLRKNFLQLLLRSKLVAVAADEELGLAAVTQKSITIQPVIHFGRSAERDDRLHPRIRTSRAHPGGRPEGESAENQRQVEFVVEPIE